MSSNAFSDEDLKRLKKAWTSRSPELASSKELKMLALIARLEAAEEVIARHRFLLDAQSLAAWKKSAGKL